jgi:hypothetical protein
VHEKEWSFQDGGRAFSITINSDAMLSINILLCLFKISAEITCMSFVRNPCFPDVAFNSKDLIFKISFG